MTPMSLQQLERLNEGGDKSGKGTDRSVERLGWGMGAMGLNVGAGEWTPKTLSGEQVGYRVGW